MPPRATTKQLKSPASDCAARSLGKTVVAGYHIRHTFLAQKVERLLQAVERLEDGGVRHIAAGIGLQHVLEVVVYAGELCGGHGV